MSVFTSGEVKIRYEEYGQGYPVLLFAPGLMRSAGALWQRQELNPIDLLAGDYRIISMDQRNAGESTAPIKATAWLCGAAASDPRSACESSRNWAIARG